ncbi:hypothetical protein ACFQ2K_07415 [Streptomyces sanglieri]|uniref:Tetratricopeptide repeat protein n=1 Tax=Streptomyces sanglieri TaxID=193460 RepID=A0ABW2WMQ5_9ACTN
MDLDRVDEARALLASRLAEDQTGVRGWAHLARCHLSVRDYAEALTGTGEALALAPEEFESHHARAYALRRSGRPDEALAEARETIRIDPQSRRALPSSQRPGSVAASLARGLRRGGDRCTTRTGRSRRSLRAVECRDDERLSRRDATSSARAPAHRPQNAWGLAERAFHAEADAARPPLIDAGSKLSTAADAYATALAADPQADRLRGTGPGTVPNAARNPLAGFALPRHRGSRGTGISDR